MTFHQVTIENPLRHGERESAMVEPGESMASIITRLGWPAAKVLHNGEAVRRAELGDVYPASGDVVLLIRLPEAALPAVFVNILVSLAISFVFAYLFPPPEALGDRDDDSSPTYGFGGVQSNRVEGLPIPTGWGKIKAGGQIINEFIDVQGFPAVTTYYALISYGEGPFNSVGGVTVDTPGATPLTGADIPLGIEINGNPAQNFSGVEAWVRLGTSQQQPIPNFDEVRQTFDNGSALLSDDVASTDTFALMTGFSNSGVAAFTTANDAFWTSYAVTVDFNTEDVDGFVVLFSMPQGFFEQDTVTGATLEAGFGFQVRYRQLDAGGAPITTGGPATDGWVRLAVQGPTAFGSRSPFQFQYKELFRDPQTYVNPVNGFCADFTAAGSLVLNHIVGLSGNMPHAEASRITRLSGSCWVLFESEPAAGTLMECTNGFASDLGWRFGVENTGPFNSVTGQQSRRLVFRFGTGSTVRTVTASSSAGPGIFDGATNQWFQVGFTYEQNVGVILYVNGQPITAFSGIAASGFDINWTRQPLAVGNNGFATQGLIDDVKVYDRSLSAPQMRSEFNNGGGAIGSVDPSAGALVFLANMDSTAGLGSLETSGAGWWDAASVLGSNTTIGTEQGITRAEAFGDLLTGRFRLEVLRVTNSSTSTNVQDDIEVAAVQSVVSRQLSYPEMPLLGIAINATEQLNGSTPAITSVNEQLPGLVWDGVSTVLPGLRELYTTNPAWIALYFILNRRIGLGRFYDFKKVYLPSFLAWAQHCDEITYDGTRRIAVDNSGAVFSDILYNATEADPDSGEVRGELELRIHQPATNDLPARFEVGQFVRLTGWPDDVATGGAVDVNSPDNEGYEIFETSFVGGVWTVRCWYDRLDEGDVWTDGLLMGAGVLLDVTLLNGAIFEGASRRFEFNGIFDKKGSAWEALLSICSVGRAAPIPTGSRLNVRFSRRREPVGVVGPSNILAGSFTVDFSSPKTRPNSITLSILDAEQGFEPVPIPVRGPEIEEGDPQAIIRQQNLTLFGVTDAGQAERHGTFLLNVNRLQRRSGTFGAALDGLPYQAGDVLRVSSDVLPRGTGGRVASSSASTRKSMISDRSALGAGSWTATDVVVTANTGTDPFGDATADSLVGTGTVEQDISPPEKSSGWYAVSLFAKPLGASNTFGLSITTDRGQARAGFVYSGPTATSNTSAEMPSSATIQAAGGGWFFCTLSVFVHPPAGNVISTLRLAIIPSAAAGSEVSKVLVTQARYAALEDSVRGIVLDTEVTITAATAPKVHLQDVRGSLSSTLIDTTITPVGTYPAGSMLFTSADMGASPVRGNPVIVSTTTDELLVEISNVSRKQGLDASFQWVEYVDAVYNDDAVEDLESRGGGVVTVPGGVIPVPGIIKHVTVQLGNVSGATGSYTPQAQVSWELDPATVAGVTGTAIFWRSPQSGQGSWIQGVATRGTISSAEFPLPSTAAGALIEFSAVPLSAAQPVGNPSEGLRSAAVASGRSWQSEPPASVEVDTAAFEATYRAVFTDGGADAYRREHVAVEFRRGGWIAGQVIGRTAEGETTLTVPGDVYLPVGAASVGRIHARALNRAGGWSDAATLDYTPVLPLSELVASVTYPSEEWETSMGGSGWFTVSPGVGEPVATNLVQDAGDLIFDGAALTGTYRTGGEGAAPVAQDQGRKPRPFFISAAVEAVQEFAVAEVDYNFDAGSLESQRFTSEGPLREEPGDGKNIKLWVEIRLNDGSGFGDWRLFRCGVYTCVDAQFRIRVTRETDANGVRISAFHTSISLPLRSTLQQSSSDLHARGEVL